MLDALGNALVDYGRLRQHRLRRAREALEASELRALLAFDLRRSRRSRMPGSCWLHPDPAGW
jgi:hypothetical protein